MRKITIYNILLLCLFVSCEPVLHADIINESDQDILLEIVFDKATLEEGWNGKPYIEFLKSYPNYNGISNLKFDSVELKSIYKIKSKASFPLESGIGHEPDFKLFRRIRIFNKDTITLENKEEIVNAFVKSDKRTWELQVK